jgi:hypothetical protein
MAKISLADKLKIIFSPEKGKDVLRYTYENIIKPNIKQTAYLAATTMLAKQMGIDEKSIPLISTTHTGYSSISKGVKQGVDVRSYLPTTSYQKRDLNSIGFKDPREANKLIDFMDECIKGPTRCCRVADVYEHLGWSISSADIDKGWKSIVGIGTLERDGLTYVIAPDPERL